MPIKWIFFDVGGVLLDETPLFEWKIRTIMDIARSLEHRFARKDVLRVWPEASKRSGNLAENAIDLLLHDRDVAKIAKDQLRSRKEDMERASAEQKIRQDALETISFLSQQYSLGLLANQPQKTRKKLADAGLLHFFTEKIVSAETAYQKPDEIFFRDTLARAGARPEESVLVDDNIERGLMPAKHIGMKTVWMKTADRADIPDGAIDYVITSLSELMSIDF